MKMNFSEYEEMIEKLTNITDYMFGSDYQNRRNTIYLGNGDRLNYSVRLESIPHLLGINIEYLKTTKYYNTNPKFYNSKDSFELTQYLLQDSYKLYTLIQKGDINFDLLFSPYIQNKINGFNNNIKISPYETLFVCKYKPERSYTTNEQHQKYDYIIVKKYENNTIGVLGIVKHTNGNFYIPMTNQLFKNENEAKEMFESYLKNQEVTIMTTSKSFNAVLDFDKPPIILRHIDKYNRLSIIKDYCDKYNCIPNFLDECKFELEKLMENRDIYNDYKDQKEDQDNFASYKNLTKELDSSKKKIEELQEEILKLKELKNNLEENNEKLNNENIENNNMLDEISNILIKRQK